MAHSVTRPVQDLMHSAPKSSSSSVKEKTSVPKFRSRHQRNDTHDGSSTESGDDSLSALTSFDGTTSDSEVEQSTALDVLIFPAAMLLRLRATLLSQRVGRANALGYTTVPRPQRQGSPVELGNEAVKPAAWTFQCRQTHDENSIEAVVRKARGILNKLTVEKFDSLYDQLALCGINTEDHLRQLMHEIFEKATLQHHFIPMYADLCMRLESDPRIVLRDDEAKGGFKSLLLDACQTAFEELLETRVSRCGDDEELLKRKQRTLGNVKLVAQLMVRGMLSSRLLVQCAEDLLQARTVRSEALESLAAFLEIVVPAFDEPSWAHAHLLDSLFWRLLDITKDKAVPARDRFLLRNVLELREAGWPMRTPIQTASPMKLEEVRTQLSSLPKSPLQAQVRAFAARGREVQRGSMETVHMTSAPAEAKPKTGAAQKSPAPTEPFCPIAFRRVLAGIIKELAQGWNVPAAVRRVRDQRVPLEHQASDFTDILTRAAEESRGPARRSAFAFAAGLAAADATSAFERSACLEGTGIFFREVYEGLAEEVPRLAIILKAEMLPTLRSVLPDDHLRPLIPLELWTP